MKYPEDCNVNVAKLVESIVFQTREVLAENLVTISLHGSLAMGSYYYPKSDVDILVVVNGALSSELRRSYFQVLKYISSSRETVGDVELTVLQVKSLEYTSISVPFEVHFSESQKEKMDSIDFSMNSTDSDLPAHLMVAYHRGITLFGQKLSDLMNEPSWDLYRKSVQDDLEWILSRENILDTPFYSILNCCRSYLLFVKNENRIYSKEEGAIKVQCLLPSIRDMIQKGLDAYRSDKPVSIQARRVNSQNWDQQDLLEFRDYFRSVFAKHGMVLNIE